MSPPSWSAVERGNPPPRRKACAACIKAKRRCTQESPVCLRCCQRGLECKYPSALPLPAKRRPLQDTPSHHQAPQLHMALGVVASSSSTTTTSSGSDSGSSSGHHATSVPTFVQLEPTHVVTIPEVTPTTHGYVITDINHVELAGGCMPGNEAAAPSLHGPEQSTAWATAESRRDRDRLALSPPLVASIEEMVSFALKARLQYALDKLAFAVNQMALESSTPWSHPYLYQRVMPREMEDAQALCALYMNKTPANKLIVLRIIESRAQELCSAPMPNTPLEILARAQALLLYQIIRLFDGDVQLRMGAEQGLGSLEEAGFALMAFIRFEEGTFGELAFNVPAEPRPELAPSSCPADVIRDFWETWVLQESARRTFLMIFFFVRTCHLIKGQVLFEEHGPCDGKLGLYHSFTLSSHLWTAKDPVDFSTAWRTKKHFVVKNADFTEVMAEAQADDLDVYGRMLVSTVIGIEQAKSWLTTRGGATL